jgi:hypothetical protein
VSTACATYSPSCPNGERERIRAAYWQALDDATDERDGKQRLQRLVDELDGAGYTAAARCLADDLDALACTCAIRPDTADGGEAQTCSSGRSPRSNGAPR